MGVAYRQGYADPQTRLERDPEDALQAGVWSWDGAFEFEDGVIAAGVRVLPETLAREGGDNEARLVRCIDGFEGQVWRNRALFASRWWPRNPTAREWQHFIRAAQAPSELASRDAPTPVDAPYRKDLPLIDREPASLKLTFAPVRIAGGAACVLAMAAAFETTQLLTHNSAAAAANAQIERALSENSAAIEARRSALTASEQINQIAQFGRTDLIARSFLAVASEIPADAARISNFRVTDQQLEARLTMLQDSEIEIPDLISRLEKNTVLGEVFVEPRTARTISVSAAIIASAPDGTETPGLRD